MPNGLFYHESLDRSISSIRGVWLVNLLPCFKEMHVFNANNVYLDQTPLNAASDVGIHCLPVSILWATRHKWIKKESLSLNFESRETYTSHISDLSIMVVV